MRAMRPAAPAWLRSGKLCHTDQLPPVTISPHFGSVSTWTIRTLSQSASSSSATMRASAVPTCWPISARMMLTVTTPLRSMPYQIVGSNSSAGVASASPAAEDGSSTAARPDRLNPSTTPVPIIAIRKPRRDGKEPPSRRSREYKILSIGGCPSQARRRQLDGLADADIGHAATEIACHHRIDVLVGRVGIIGQQGGGLHDLPRLAIAALRRLQLDPGGLHRVPALGVEPLDRRHLGAGNRADRGDAGPRRATFDMDGAGAAEADPAAAFGPGDADLVADRPQQRRVIRAAQRNGAAIEIERDHDRTAPDIILVSRKLP